MQLVENQITLPNGLDITHTQLNHPGASVILPILDNGEILLIHQFRPALGKWLIELPAGTLESNEDPLSCAQRELAEETGFQARQWQAMGRCTPMAGFCDEIQYLFLAHDLSHNQQHTCDVDEVIELKPMSLAQIEAAICDDIITDAKTIACLSKAKLMGLI
ncbi:MAG: NUDIX hydrolase [Vibrio sp.]